MIFAQIGELIETSKKLGEYSLIFVIMALIIWYFKAKEKRYEDKINKLDEELKEITKEMLVAVTTSNSSIDKVVNQFDHTNSAISELKNEVKESRCKNGR